MTEPTKRQRLPWPWWRRVWRELVWFVDLDDGSGDGSPSLTKWIALMTALVAFVAILAEVPVSGMQVSLIIIAISAAFGRSMWRAYLARVSSTFTASDTTARSKVEQVIRHEIVQRRKEGAEDGTEPTD